MSNDPINLNQPVELNQDAAIQQMIQDVGGALSNGVPPNQIVSQLVESGMPEQDARGLVSNVAQQMQSNPQQKEGGGIPGWVIWIGLLLLINLLSHLFNWGWVIY